mgnify:CR=1 FL=1
MEIKFENGSILESIESNDCKRSKRACREVETIMEKVEEKIVEAKRKIHKFYCDKCGKYLGENEEYDDGYYEDIGYVIKRIVVNEKQYLYKRHLCDKCKEKFYEDLGNVLEVVGFVKVE